MDWKKMGKKMLFLPCWLMLILTLFSTAALIWVFVKGLEESPIAYIIYVIAFYTLTVVCVFIGFVFPKQYKKIRKRVYENPLGNRYMTDIIFRTHISLSLSLVVNMLYVGMNVLFYVIYQSMWFVILSGYYMILSAMRFLLVGYMRNTGIGTNRLGELKSARCCSWILLTINFVLSGAVLMILYQNKGFEYHGVLIYLIAAYTFYTTIQALVNMIKFRKYRSPVLTTTKVIALSAALVSMLSLETAMLSQFGQEMTAKNKWLMIALTGAGVSIVVVVMSIYMIVNTAKEIKKMKEEEYGT